MNQGEYIAILGATISFLIGILAYFVNKWISNVEESVKTISTQQYKDNKSVEKLIEQNTLNLNLLVKNNESQIMLVKNSFDHISKKVDGLEKMTESINKLDGKIIQIETRIESLGKVIHIGRGNK